jgi:NhaP-type Na+/H+ or K+/H+ antiporter
MSVPGETLVAGTFDWRIVLYSMLSLTVVRMVPVFPCLRGSGLNTETKLFIGRFGPHGPASIDLPSSFSTPIYPTATRWR